MVDTPDDPTAASALRARLDALEGRCKAAEAQLAPLREAERRHRRLLDSVQWIAVGLDAAGRLAYANPAFLHLSGYTAAEALGKDWFASFVPEHERARERGRFAGLLAARTPVRHESDLVTRSAEVRRIAWDSIVVFDLAGGPIGSESLGDDVTDRRRAEVGQRDSDASYRAIIDLAVDAVVTIDHLGTIESFNRAAVRIFGYEAQEVIGRNVRLLMPSPYREEHDDYLGRYLATGKANVIGTGREVVARRKDGSVFPVDLAVSEVVRDGRRTFTGMVRDITRRRRAEILASTATLASGMAHEIGTPLNVILGRAERTRDRLKDSEAVRDLDIIIRQVERVTRIIQQLLAISRPHPSERRATDLNQVVRTTLEAVEERLRRHRIAAVSELDPDLPLVFADADRMSQVLLNLVVNAIDAMAAEGALRVRTAVRERGTDDAGAESVEIAVTDTGCGISPEHLPRIFDPFFTTKSVGRGTGLGLAVVHGIVRDHGGDIAIETELGKGSTFRVWLPIRSTPTTSPDAA